MLFYCLAFFSACQSSLQVLSVREKMCQESSIPFYSFAQTSLMEKLSPLNLNFFQDSLRKAFYIYGLAPLIIPSAPDYHILKPQQDYHYDHYSGNYQYVQAQFNSKTLVYKEALFQIHSSLKNSKPAAVIFLLWIDTNGSFLPYEDTKKANTPFIFSLDAVWIDPLQKTLMLRFPLAEIEFSQNELAAFHFANLSLSKVLSMDSVQKDLLRQINAAVLKIMPPLGFSSFLP